MATENIAGKIDLDKLPEKLPVNHKPEKPAPLELRPEKLPERESNPENSKESKMIVIPEKIEPTLLVPMGSVSAFQKQRAQEIDNILSEGLHDVFLKMDAPRQKEFKRVGEETALKIAVMMEKGKFKISKIIELIKKWLKIIPGVNKFFLEQEAKIKADKIMRLK
ncbi:MAG: hypothetical protein HY931_01075 [Candidatus Falkowbacteria bacterium]|nr:MAG: hypothetical protein HY931_01075 [Candidatus Falkowbacteria bacterium]